MVIQFKNVSKKFGEVQVLNDLSLEIKQGEMVAIVGKSGSGKSTLLNIMGLLEPKSSGTIKILGQKNLKPFNRKSLKLLKEDIGFLFQNYALLDDKTVEYNLGMVVSSSRIKSKGNIKEVLKKVGLEGFENKIIHQCSGGEQQRVAIARLLLKKSNLIFADEPTGSLDESNRNIIVDLLKGLNEQGKTIVIVTHDSFVAQSCDRVIEI